MSKSEEEEQFDSFFYCLIGLIYHIRDKDEFFDYFRKSLSTRLLNKPKLYNEAVEKKILEKLKERFGFNLIKSYMSMFSESHEESLQEINQKFQTQKNPKAKTSIDLEVKVLNGGLWLIPHSHVFPIVLPTEMREAQQMFDDFYEENEHLKKLSWLTGLLVV